jgi:hypothetical protein
MLVIRFPANVDAANTVHVSPPSLERATPKPGLPSEARLLELPVPANMTLGSAGLIASDRIERAGNCWSVSGVQLGLIAVEFVVLQIPPFTVAM